MNKSGFASAARYGGDSYRWWAESKDAITIERNGVPRTFKVKEDGEFTYSVKKTQINACGGAERLRKFIDSCWDDNGVWARPWLDALLVRAYDNVKPMNKED